VAGRVDDVYLGAFVGTSGVFGINSDAALALERVGVHRDALFGGACLAQQSIGQGGLAVVDVRDNSDVSDFHNLKMLTFVVGIRIHGM
jgi:hypothetical protein